MSEERKLDQDATMYYRCNECGETLLNKGYVLDEEEDVCLNIGPCRSCIRRAVDLAREPVPICSLEGLAKRVNALERAAELDALAAENAAFEAAEAAASAAEARDIGSRVDALEEDAERTAEAAASAADDMRVN